MPPRPSTTLLAPIPHRATSHCTPRRRHLRYVTVAWFFGSIWFAITASPLLTTYARALGCGDFEFGLINALPFFATILSLPSAAIIDATGERKRIFLAALYFQRGVWLVFPLAVYLLWGSVPASVTLVVFLGSYFAQQIGQAVGGPAWQVWMADIIPQRVRGRYIARRRQYGVFTAIPAAVLVGYLTDRVTGSHLVHTDADRDRVLWWCSALFVVVAVCGIIDILLFQFIPHTRKVVTRGTGLAATLASMLRPLADRDYLRFVAFIAGMFFTNGLLGQFLNRYVQEQVLAGSVSGLNLLSQLMLVIVPMATSAVVLPVWGAAADRFGAKPLLVAASAGFVPVAAGWMFVTPEWWGLGFVMAALTGVFWIGIEVTNFNYLTSAASAGGEAGEGKGGSSYVAVHAVVTSVAAAAGGLTGGVIAQSLSGWTWRPTPYTKTFTHFDVLFAACVVVRLAAFVAFVPRLKNIGRPDARHPLAAARFMIETLYVSATGIVALPRRLLRWRTD